MGLRSLLITIKKHSALTGLTADDHTQYQKETEKGAASGYAELDAGSKVPVAQVPDLAASKITSGQFPLARLPRVASGQFLEGGGAGADPIYNALAAGDIPSLAASKITSGRFPLTRIPTGSSGYVLTGQGASSPSYQALSTLTYVEIIPPAVQKPANNFTWEDWDLTSATEGGAKYAVITAHNPSAIARNIGIRRNGSAAARYIEFPAGKYLSLVFVTEMGSGEIVETYGVATESEFYLTGYWK